MKDYTSSLVRVAATVAVLTGCGSPRPSASPRATAAIATDLHMSVTDEEQVHASCDGVAPVTVQVEVDGTPVGATVIACSTVIEAPPPRFAVPVFTVPAGDHEIALLDSRTNRRTAKTLHFPKIVPFDDGAGGVVADHLGGWIGPRGPGLGELVDIASAKGL